uniref:E3 ubiquitin-protein ligase RNF126 n=1 Tax=Anas zonorhyncha TaxID=75864 RepID=A0A8B9VU39_9AVES
QVQCGESISLYAAVRLIEEVSWAQGCCSACTAGAVPLPAWPWHCSVAPLAGSDHRERAAEGVAALRELPGSPGAVAGTVPVAWGRGCGLQGSALPGLLVALCPLAFLTLFLLPQDYICPRCESGFIEELPEEPRNTDNETSSSTSTSDQSRHPFENVDQHLFTLPQGYGQFAFGIFDDGFEIPFGSNVQPEDNRDSENRREREHQSRHRYGARQPRARLAARRAAGRHEGVPTLEGIIQQLVNGIIAPTTIPNLGLGPWGVLHSNPMDYAWGANGLDAIITQLLNQFENTGPPPADKEKIQALPTIQITQEHVDSGLECPVCKEDYTVGENVRQLPCNHLFHNSCIVPWLEQHDTCPVCRKSLSGQNTATNPPGLTGMNFSSSSSSSSSSSPILLSARWTFPLC